MKFFLKRLREPSSWAGIPAIAGGLAVFLNTPEVADVGQIVVDAGAQALTGNYIGAGLIAATGLAAVFLPEKARG